MELVFVNVSASIEIMDWIEFKLIKFRDVDSFISLQLWFDLFTSPGGHYKKSIGSRYLSDFYIYTLEWTPNALVWKINGVEVMRQTTGVPQEPMYINFAGGVDKPIGGISSMEVDWVRVYE